MLKRLLTTLLSGSMFMSGIGLPVLANEQDPEIEEMESIVEEMNNGSSKEINESNEELKADPYETPGSLGILQREGLAYQLFEDGHANVQGGTNQTITEVFIPSKVSFKGIEYKVLNIGHDLNYNKSQIKFKTRFTELPNLKKVTIEEGIETVANTAFGSCQNLEAIIFPNTITHYGQEVLYNCPKLKSVSLSNQASINRHMFSNCTSLEEVAIPDGVLGIAGGAFEACPNLRKIIIPSSVNKLGDYKTATISDHSQNVIIYGSIPSTAYNYAKKYGIPFKELDLEPFLKNSAVLPNFDLQKDTFSFRNSPNNFYQFKWMDEYGIQNSVLVRKALSKGFLPSDIAALLKRAQQEWNGACFGMTQSVMENYKNIFPLTNKESNSFLTDDLINLEPPVKNNEVLNEINFRQLLQRCAAYRSKRFNFINKKAGYQRIEQLLTLLSDIENSKQPIGICFTSRKEDESQSVHSVLAYGVLTGNYQFLNNNFKYKILLVDPNYPPSQEKSPYILINEDKNGAILIIDQNTYFILYTGYPCDLLNEENRLIIPDHHFIFSYFSLNTDDIYDTTGGNSDHEEAQFVVSTLRQEYNRKMIWKILNSNNEIENINKNNSNEITSINLPQEDGTDVTIINGLNGQGIQFFLNEGAFSFQYQNRFIYASCEDGAYLTFFPDTISVEGKASVNLEITQNNSYIKSTDLYTLKLKVPASNGKTTIDFNNQTIEKPEDTPTLNIELSNLLGDQNSKTEITTQDIIKFNDLNKSNSDPINNPVSTAEKSSMYRLYNPNSGEHFYTADKVEKDHLVSVGWDYEGLGWNAPKTSNTPVYRLYNENAGDHHYTTDSNEKDTLVRIGWKDEKIGWYSDDQKGVPLYRVYNPNAQTGSHHYTTDKTEQDYLVGIGWNYEGIAWYGMK